MIVSMKRSGRDLHPCSRREEKPTAHSHTSKAKSRCKENLFVTGVWPGLVERGVHFQFRPKLQRCPILESCVPLKLAPDFCRAARGQVSAKRGLHIESAPAFASRDCRRQDGLACSVAIGSRRRGRGEDKRQ